MPIATTTAGTTTITGYTYVWIDDLDDSSRGLTWKGNDLRAFSGYVIDPGYFPKSVSGSPLVGPYLGASLPREVLLVRQIGTPDV
jgi:hypothetical protein